MPAGTGRAIFGEMMGMQFRNVFGMGMGAEILYSFIIILCSLMIYRGTKELYELSSYQGIKYFRQAFLFFAIAYFFRSFIKFIVVYFDASGIIDFSPLSFGAVGIIAQFLFMYLSSMAVFYLLYSVISRKLSESHYRIYLLHGFAILIALISILSRNLLTYLFLNLLLLGITSYVIYFSNKNSRPKRKHNRLYFIYILLSVFWILNIIDALLPKFFQGAQLFIYMASIGIFLLILYKVLKNTGAD